MKVKQIAFLGDSFTWGEGLELYLDTPFWIEQREKLSTWSELKKIQTDESVSFREKNRFASIVSDYFNSDSIIKSNNGGYIGSITESITNILNKNLKPDFAIIQFSSFMRNPIHYHHRSLTYECKCKKCNEPNPGGTKHGFFHLFDCIRKKYLEFEELNETDLFYLNWLTTEFQLDSLYLEDNNPDSWDIVYSYMNSVMDSYSLLHLNYLLHTYVNPLESRGTKVFYIDSWEDESSKTCHLIPNIEKNMIELQGYENHIITKNYYEFETTFPYTRISSEFPKTNNGHPTLIQHQYIAKSIIDKIENFDKKSFF